MNQRLMRSVKALKLWPLEGELPGGVCLLQCPLALLCRGVCRLYMSCKRGGARM